MAWIKRDFPGVTQFRVKVEECVVAEQVERVPVEVRRSQLLFDGAGRAGDHGRSGQHGR